MQGLPFVLIFTAMTFLSWGAYGPLLRHGTMNMGHDGLKAFVGVGLAYFVIAVIVPLAILRRNGEKGSWSLVGTTYSIIAGSVGAIGALGIILALVFKGSPVYVMPLVFGFAPIVNTLVTAWMGKTFANIRPIFIAGIVAAALGAGGVLYFKPPAKAQPHASAPIPIVQVSQSDVAKESQSIPEPTDKQNVEAKPEDQKPEDLKPENLNADQAKTDQAKADEAKVDDSKDGETKADEARVDEAQLAGNSKGPSIAKAPDAGTNFGMVALSIAMAALCWGSYGPMLHQGQMKMGGSRLRPFACVGIAYFIIAVAVPLILLKTTPSISQSSWTVSGLTWSIIAGAAGALGALGIILAFNSGGKPIYVMPLVFGFAPVINTFISLTEAGVWAEVPQMFWVSLAVVIAGAITVLTTAPKANHGPPRAPATPSAAAGSAN